MTFRRIFQHDDHPDAVMCEHEDGRMFVILSETGRAFAEVEDRTALAAIDRAWASSQDHFRLVTPRARPVIEPALPGVAADLTEKDRQKLYRIIDKHWRFYFAAPPTIAQKDNLIDGLGARVAEKIVRKEQDRGRL